MSLKELVAKIGKDINVRVENWIVRMKIYDVKLSYGRALFLVKPLAGEGESWITTDRIIA